VGEAEESLSLVQQRFENGLAPLSDLLGVRSALDRARWDRLQAETELLETLGRRAFEQGLFLKTLLPQEENRP
jgi:outer membrane protein TolC